MALTLLTPTGSRPEAWELCKRWMRNQDYTGQVTWIIVDDGTAPQKMIGFPEHWYILVVYPSPASGDTTLRNIRQALEYVMDEDPRLVLIADDNYYGPRWLSQCDHALNKFNLAGEARNPRFDLERLMYRRGKNVSHADLWATALRGDAIGALRTLLDAYEWYLDEDLWYVYTGNKLLTEGEHVVLMNGLPGRKRAGAGDASLTEVADVSTLRRLVGEDVAHYLQHLGGTHG